MSLNAYVRSQVAFEKSTSKDQDCRYHWLALATLMTVVPIFVVGEWSKCTRVSPCVLLEPGRMSWFTPRWKPSGASRHSPSCRTTMRPLANAAAGRRAAARNLGVAAIGRRGAALSIVPATAESPRPAADARSGIAPGVEQPRLQILRPTTSSTWALPAMADTGPD